MKNIIAAVFLAVTSIAAMAQAVDQASIAQKQRQLSNAGAVEGKKAYASGGLYALAKSSSDCMESVKSGAASAYKCMGIEALGLALTEKTPANNKTELAKNWFDSKTMTNRVYAYCFMFLGIRSDVSCAQAFSTAKMASDAVIASTSLFSGDTMATTVPAANPPSANATPATATEGYKVSYQCNASGLKDSEIRVCANSKLSRLDGLLDSTYKSRLEPIFQADKKYMRTQQLNWLAQKNRCGNDDVCIEASYRDRIRNLCGMPVPSGVKPAHDCDTFED